MKDFQVGEKVIHSNYGLGEVIQIDEKVLSDEPTRCYVVKVRDLKIWVPAGEKSTGSLRRPTPPSKFDRLFAILRSPGEPLSDNRFERKTQLSESLRNGKPEGICQVIRDLSYFGQSKKLNESDKTLLQRAQNFLLSEWVYSFPVSLDQAQQELASLLGTQAQASIDLPHS
jgi:RNA polymerase-interacting CarD/CdnL/TRCF family regulator